MKNFLTSILFLMIGAVLCVIAIPREIIGEIIYRTKGADE